MAVGWAVTEVNKLPWCGNIILEGDSATAVAWIGGEPGSKMPVLLEARRLISIRGGFSMSFTPRDGNILANDLAFLGRSCTSSCIWDVSNAGSLARPACLANAVFVACDACV